MLSPNSRCEVLGVSWNPYTLVRLSAARPLGSRYLCNQSGLRGLINDACCSDDEVMVERRDKEFCSNLGHDSFSKTIEHVARGWSTRWAFERKMQLIPETNAQKELSLSSSHLDLYISIIQVGAGVKVFPPGRP